MTGPEFKAAYKAHDIRASELASTLGLCEATIHNWGHADTVAPYQEFALRWALQCHLMKKLKTRREAK